MRFAVTLIEPPGERYGHFLHDVARYLLHTIRLLGHDCSLTRNRCDVDAINVLVGTHLLGSLTELDVLLGGARHYVVLQTEIVADGSLNGQSATERLESVTFPMLRSAAAVWESLETTAAFLETKGVKASLLRFGYDPLMRDVTHVERKDIDFLFYGSLGPWRQQVLGELEGLGYRVQREFDAVAFYRNDLMARAEIVLTLRHGDGMSHLPQGRIIHAVNNRCLVVGEGGTGQAALEDLFLWTNDPRELIELCRAARARSDRRELADTFHDRLKQRPMTEYLRPLLDELTAPTSLSA